MQRRIYVDAKFAKKLKILAVHNEKSVIDLTRNLDLELKNNKKRSKYSPTWVNL